MIVEAESVVVPERYTPVGLGEKEDIFIFDHYSVGNAAHDGRGPLRQDALLPLLLLLRRDLVLALDRMSGLLLFRHLNSSLPVHVGGDPAGLVCSLSTITPSPSSRAPLGGHRRRGSQLR